jgi:hypothetical protein
VSDPFAEFDTPKPDASSSPDPEAPGESTDTETDAEASIEPAHERRRRWPGFWSAGVAAGMVVVTIVAVTLASQGEAVYALTLTASALALAGIAIVLGIVSIVGRYARPWGIAGLAVGVLVNPLVLLYGLSAMGMY